MDANKAFTILSGFLLIICLVLSITALTVMRNAVEESKAWQTRAQTLVNELNECVQAHTEKDSLPVSKPNEESSANVDSHALGLTLRIEGEKLFICTEQGFLLYLPNIPSQTLSPETKEQLERGIVVNSWEELFSLLQDLEG